MSLTGRLLIGIMNLLEKKAQPVCAFFVIS